MNEMQGAAAVTAGRDFFGGASGRWAGEQFMRAMRERRPISPSDLRTLEVLTDDEWKVFDTAAIAEASLRLRIVADLIARGNVMTIANGMAKTVLEFSKIGDMDPAIVTMDGVGKSENDRMDETEAGLPLPITHKDFWINLRTLMASRLSGNPFDVAYPRVAGRKVAEETERMLVNGGKTYKGYTIYGLRTHPDRNTLSFGTNGDWAQAAKTGDNIIADVNSMIGRLQADGFYGPYWIYYGADASLKMGEDYKAASDKTIMQRILEIDGVERVGVSDQVPAANVVMFQPTEDVVDMISGENLQTVQWDIHGGFVINFKVLQILVPRVRSGITGKSGIAHMS